MRVPRDGWGRARRSRRGLPGIETRSNFSSLRASPPPPEPPILPQVEAPHPWISTTPRARPRSAPRPSAFLDAHAARRLSGATRRKAPTMEEVFQEPPGLAEAPSRPTAGVPSPGPKPFGGRGLGPDRADHLERGAHEARLRPTAMLAVGIGMAGPDADRARHRRPEGAPPREAAAPRRRGVVPAASPSRARARTSPSLATRAVRDGDDWIVNGQKTWCSGAQHAEFGILIARTDPKAPKHQGITYFLLDMSDARHRGAAARRDDRRGALQRGLPGRTCAFRTAHARRRRSGRAGRITQTTLMNERMAMGGTLEPDRLRRRSRALVQERLAALDAGDETTRVLLRDELAAGLHRAQEPGALERARRDEARPRSDADGGVVGHEARAGAGHDARGRDSP